MTEEWRPVVGFEGWYEVSSKGRVRSMPRTIIQQSTPSNAMKWYGGNEELDPYEIAHDWGGKVIVLREDEE